MGAGLPRLAKQLGPAECPSSHLPSLVLALPSLSPAQQGQAKRVEIRTGRPRSISSGLGVWSLLEDLQTHARSKLKLTDHSKTKITCFDHQHPTASRCGGHPALFGHFRILRPRTPAGYLKGPSAWILWGLTIRRYLARLLGTPGILGEIAGAGQLLWGLGIPGILGAGTPGILGGTFCGPLFKTAWRDSVGFCEGG